MRSRRDISCKGRWIGLRIFDGPRAAITGKGHKAMTRAAEIASPCIKVCVIDPKARLCRGCFRTIDEITQWARMSPQERDHVMAGLTARQDALG